MIRVKLFTKQGIVSGGVEMLDEWNPALGQLVWVDVDRERPDDARELLSSRFKISTLVLDDIHRKRHPPKLENLANCWFLMVRGLDPYSNSLDFDTIQLAFLVGNNFIITAHEEESVSVDFAWDTIADQTMDALIHPEGEASSADALALQLINSPALHGAELLAYTVLRRLTDRYQPVITQLEERLESIEEEMFESPSDKLLAELMSYSRQLKKLRRICRYHETHLKRLLIPTSKPLLHHATHEFNDVYEHQERLATSAQMHLEITNDLINGYLSLSAHRLNQVMRVLTVVTVLFVPLTFIAGIYGMNFNSEVSPWNMPELGMKYGYPIAIGVMLTIAIVLLVIFKRRKWL